MKIYVSLKNNYNFWGNEELCDFVRSRLEVTDDLEKVCNEVVDTCLYKVARLFLFKIKLFYAILITALVFNHLRPILLRNKILA